MLDESCRSGSTWWTSHVDPDLHDRAGTTEHHKYPGVPGLCHIVPEICVM